MLRYLRNRNSLVFVIIVCLFILLIIRIFYWQFLDSRNLDLEGKKRQLKTLNLEAKRGNIVDRNGKILAMSIPLYSVWVDPYLLSSFKRLDPNIENYSQEYKKLFNQYSASVIKLSEILRLNRETLIKNIELNKNKKFLYIKRKLDLKEIATLFEDKQGNSIKPFAIYKKKEYKRYYPSAEVNAQLLGFTDINDQGQEGLELNYNEWLDGTHGKLLIIRSILGEVLEFKRTIKPKQAGKDLVLSIDNKIQFLAYHAFKKAIQQHEANSGALIINDAKTGEILAMVSQPSFNPNNRKDIEPFKVRNRAISIALEPGSTVKPFIIAEALQRKLVNLNTKIHTGNGLLKIDDIVVNDARAYGNLSIVDVLKYSSNIGAVKIANMLGNGNIYKLFNRIGFNSSELKLPAEYQGYHHPIYKWTDVYRSSVSYGYGININLAQLAGAYTILANNGYYTPLSIFKITSKPKLVKVFDKHVAKKVLNALEQTVQSGTAQGAKIDYLQVAGKTGTVRNLEKGKYSRQNHTAFFIGIVPSKNPQYVISLYIKDPARGYYSGGDAAAPVFKEIVNQLLLTQKIKNAS